MSKKPQSWNVKATELKNNPKWLKQGTTVTVEVGKHFDETVLDGKFGKRKVYIIWTEQYGRVYVGETAFARLASAVAELPDGVDTYTTEV